MRLEKAKPKHRKGLWSPEEDEKLRDYVLRHGHGSWSSVPDEIGLQRNGKSCRLRWINYLRPGLKRGTFSKNEEEMIFSLHRDLGNKWSRIAQKLPGRTDNEIKNHWHTHMKKRSLTGVSATAESLKLGWSRSTSNGSSFSSLDYSSLKPVSSNGSFQNSSTYTNTALYSGLNNSFSKEGVRGLMPKVIFGEWLSSTKLNSFDDQLGHVFSGSTFMYDGQLFSMDKGSLDFASGGGWPSDGAIFFPDYLGTAHGPSSGFSDLGSSADHGICSTGFNQIYATSDPMRILGVLDE